MQQKVIMLLSLFVQVMFLACLVEGTTTNMSDAIKEVLTTEQPLGIKPQLYGGLSSLEQNIRNSTFSSDNTLTTTKGQSMSQDESNDKLSSIYIAQGNTTLIMQEVKLEASSEEFGFEQSESENLICNDPMKVVSSVEIFNGAKFHADCQYDFQCNFGCFTGQKRYNCQCDLMCWFHGDCCYDFYSKCLGVSIDSEDSDILKAILRKLEFESQVRYLFRMHQLLNLSSCLNTHVNQANILINKCGDNPEIKNRFKALYEKIFVENQLVLDRGLFQGNTILGLSMEDVKQRCEQPSLITDIFENAPNYITLGSERYNDIHLPSANFGNRYCSICNGVPPAEAMDWHSQVICDNNKTFTLLDADSYTEFMEAIHEFNCTIKYTALWPIVSRYCFITDLTDKTIRQVEACDKSAREASSGMKRGNYEEICLGTRLCGRYSFRFTDASTKKTYANPHCYFITANNNTGDNVGHTNSSVDYCRFTTNPCDKDLMYTFTDNIESFRQLFRIRTEEQARKTVEKKKCSGNEVYVPELNSCSPVKCSTGTIPIAGRCYTKHNESEVLHKEHRVHNAFLPFEVASVVNRYGNTKVMVKVRFNNGAAYVAKDNSHCQNDIDNRSITDVMLNENSLLQFWQSCIVEKVKIDLVSEFTQMLFSVKKFHSLQIDKIVYCELTNFSSFKCSEVFNKTIGGVRNSKSFFYNNESCQRNHTNVQSDSREEENINACLLFELPSNTFLELKYKLLETYRSLKSNLRFDPLWLIDITLEYVKERSNTNISKGSSCPLDRTLQDVRLNVTQGDHNTELIHINFDELPEMDMSLLVTWSVRLESGIETLYPDNVVISLCVRDGDVLSCPSSYFVEFYYSDVIFEQSHLIVSSNKTEGSDFFLDLDFLITSVNDIELEIKKHFGENFIYIVPKSEFVLLESSFLVCTSFLNNAETDFERHMFSFVPSSKAEKIATFLSSLLSITCLTLSILTYTILPVLRANVPGKIVFCLSITLLFSHLLFLLSLYPKDIVCKIYSASHHAAWLSSFAWQSAMAFHLSQTLRNHNIEGTALSVYKLIALLCWGLPLLFVFILFFLDLNDILHMDYGLGEICWIGNFTASLVTFAAPVILSVVFSLTCSFFVINAIRMSAVFRRSYATSYSNLKRQILLCVNLSLLMGLGWIFYFLAVPADIPYLWIPFLVCHGSQGFFIFVCFIAKKNTFTLLYNKLFL